MRRWTTAPRRKQRVPRRCSLVGCDVNPQTRESNEAHDIEFVEANGLDIDWAAFHSEHGFDLVISNPPFLSQLSASTTRKGASKRGGGPYANSAMEFCLAGVEALRPGGRLAIVLPQSVLASRDTAELRSRVTSLMTPVTSWWSSSPQFDADVTVAVLIFERRKASVVEVTLPGRLRSLLRSGFHRFQPSTPPGWSAIERPLPPTFALTSAASFQRLRIITTVHLS